MRILSILFLLSLSCCLSAHNHTFRYAPTAEEIELAEIRKKIAKTYMHVMPDYRYVSHCYAGDHVQEGCPACRERKDRIDHEGFWGFMRSLYNGTSRTCHCMWQYPKTTAALVLVPCAAVCLSKAQVSFSCSTNKQKNPQA